MGRGELTKAGVLKNHAGALRCYSEKEGKPLEYGEWRGAQSDLHNVKVTLTASLGIK